jgi:hypothetical protein
VIKDQWLVTRGLKPGDQVIVEGVQFAKPGATVQVVEFRPDAPADIQTAQAGAAPAVPR